VSDDVGSLAKSTDDRLHKVEIKFPEKMNIKTDADNVIKVTAIVNNGDAISAGILSSKLELQPDFEWVDKETLVVYVKVKEGELPATVLAGSVLNAKFTIEGLKDENDMPFIAEYEDLNATPAPKTDIRPIEIKSYLAVQLTGTL